MGKSRNNRMCSVGSTTRVNIETGEETPVEGGGFRMLPGAPGTCEWCCVKHDPGQPHNRDSLPYQMRFHAINGRWPTWTDAMAHCSPEVRAEWRKHLIEMLRERGFEFPADLLEDK